MGNKRKSFKPRYPPKECVVDKIPCQFCFCPPATGIKGPGIPAEWKGWGPAIRDMRDFLGIDQTTFGKLIIGYTRSQISRFEMELTEPPIDFWVKLAKYFGINITWILTGSGMPYTEEFLESDERRRYQIWSELYESSSKVLVELLSSELEKQSDNKNGNT